MAKFREKFGEGDAATISRTILDLAVQFLREHVPTDKKGRELQLKS
jgi:hypothetical protein